jgi:two-component system, LytTR family, response regulator
MKAIIIDDEPLARMLVKEYLQTHTNIELVQECGDGFAGLKAISEHKPDLIFLDIQMPKITGFEMLELIDEPPKIIFTTAFDEYAIKAFDANAVDYLLKPFSKERFDKAIQKIAENNTYKTETLIDAALQGPLNKIVLKDNGKIKIIPCTQIHYLEAADDYVKIIATDCTFLKKKTMQFFENNLSSNDFVRVHRSYIVNTQIITRIDLLEKDNYQLLLTTGATLPVSKNGYGRLKEKLGI